jgi:hypothetical protein
MLSRFATSSAVINAGTVPACSVFAAHFDDAGLGASCPRCSLAMFAPVFTGTTPRVPGTDTIVEGESELIDFHTRGEPLGQLLSQTRFGVANTPP